MSATDEGNYQVLNGSVRVSLDDLAPAERLDSLLAQVTRIAGDGVGEIAVDLSGLTRMTSDVLGQLLTLQRNCTARNIRLSVDGSAPRVQAVLARSGMTGVLHITS